MSGTPITDDELVELLDRTMRAVAAAAPEMSVEHADLDGPGTRSRWLAAAAAAVLVVAGLLGIGALRSQQPGEPAAADVPSPAAADLDAGTPTAPRPWPATIAAADWTGELPPGVPYPDGFSMVTPMTWDMVQVGWELYDQATPTDSVQRCVDYVAQFDPRWTSIPDTDEGETVLYAQHLRADGWDVGVYCATDGMFLVQVIEASALDALGLDADDAALLAPGIGLVESGVSTPESSSFASEVASVLSSHGWDVELREHATRTVAEFDLEWAYYGDGDHRLFFALGPAGLLESFPVLVAELTPTGDGFEWPAQSGATTVALVSDEHTLLVRSESIDRAGTSRDAEQLWEVARAVADRFTPPAPAN